MALKEALFFEKLKGGEVKCRLCPHGCVIPPGAVGLCKARENRDGILFSLIYGECSAVNMDPIEKKPLFHFFPGSEILSLGTIYCNFSCKFCQNWHLVRGDVRTEYISPERVVEVALDYRSIGIAYTYNEPIIWYEFVLDTAKLAKEKGLKNVLVTNGFIEEEPLKELLPFVDAMNVDLKASSDDFYVRLCGGKVEPVLRTIELANNSCLVEVTNLLITGENDSDEDIKSIVSMISEIDPLIPLHFSRYFPQYKMNNPPTPISRLYRAYEIAREKMPYVYLGNLWEERYETTYCLNCGSALVRRRGYVILENNLEGNKCSFCGTENRFIVS
ncbi:MAG: AmmeMemoRadiSam system radical SAM enzyme [Synergistetes bacterium]|nr:AmmeMemoRadiSam system radical SAM enzyme [Synergistota bacterium]